MNKLLLLAASVGVSITGALGNSSSNLQLSPDRDLAVAPLAASTFSAHAVSVSGGTRKLATGQPGKTIDDYSYLKDEFYFFNTIDRYEVDGAYLGISTELSTGGPNYLYKSGSVYYPNLSSISFSFFDFSGLDDRLFEVIVFDRDTQRDYSGYYHYDYIAQTLYIDESFFYTNSKNAYCVGIITDDPGNYAEVEELYQQAIASPEYKNEQYSYGVYGLKGAESFLDRNNVSHNVPGNASRDIYVDIDNPLTEAQILSQFSAVDVFGTPCTFSKVSSNYPTIPAEGLYTLIYSAADAYGNTALLTIKAHLMSYRPIIEPKDGASNKVTFNYSTGATLSQVLSFFKATSYDGRDLKLALKAGQEFNRHQIGETTYTITADDGRNHSTEYEIIVDISQDVPPTVIFSDAIIICDVNNPLSIVAVKKILERQLGVTGFEDLTIESPYFDKTKQPAGSYKVSYSGTTDEGDAIAGVVTLKAEDFSDSGHSHNPLCFFKSLWAAICRGFTSWKWYWEWVE